MTASLRQIALMLVAGLIAPAPTRADDLPVRLGKVPDLRLTPRPAVTVAEARRIKGLIADLAKLDQPDFGLSATLSGDAFAPLPGQSRAGAFLLTDHRLRPSETLKALVARGPDALPFLLDALDDATPTKITLKHEGGFGGMWHAAELHLNPVNPREADVYKARAAKPRDEEEDVKSYTLKVGDVCFVAIGQIVGRGYSAVRYQPTACVILNTPAHDPKLCAEVRAIWKSKDPAGTLFASLLADYATEGVTSKKFPDAWDAGDRLQGAAALRLLYYFPKETAEFIAGRLDKLDVGRRKGTDDYIRRVTANGGVRADDFLKAVAWCQEPAVRKALVRLFKRAEDVGTLLAALPGVEDKALIRARLEPRMAKLPAEERGLYGDGYRLLIALAHRTPDTARAVFEGYLRDASTQRCQIVCLALREVEVAWDVDLLDPLLADTRTLGSAYTLPRSEGKPRPLIRVCDEVAVTLSHHYPDLKFTPEDENANLDQQIAAIREQLKVKKK